MTPFPVRGGLVLTLTLALLTPPSRVHADCGCLPVDGGNSIYYDCNGPVPAACRPSDEGNARGGRAEGNYTPGLLDRVFGGQPQPQSDNDWQAEAARQQAAALDESRLEVQNQAKKRAKKKLPKDSERARPKTSEDDMREPDTVSQEEKEDVLSQMHGLDQTSKRKDADDDGLQLRGFDKSQQPSLGQSQTEAALPRLCADCLGSYTAESRACDANVNLLGRSDCLSRAAGIWKRCVAAVDCPAELRTEIPAASDFSGDWYLCTDRYQKECREEFGTIAYIAGRWRFADGQNTAESSKQHLAFKGVRTAAGYEDFSFDISKDGRSIKGTVHTVTVGGPRCKEEECDVTKYIYLVKKP